MGIEQIEAMACALKAAATPQAENAVLRAMTEALLAEVDRLDLENYQLQQANSYAAQMLGVGQ